MNSLIKKNIAVVGAGPAGLFASECLLTKGFSVSLYDQMPSPGCKFLTAGSHGGLNITNTTPLSEFASRYGENKELFTEFLAGFSPTDMQNWLASLNVKTFTGSGGKIFPQGVSTSEILALWMDRLRQFPGFSFFPKHRLCGIENNDTLIFDARGTALEGTCDAEIGEKTDVRPDAVIFALGGASWPSTGSDGRWTELFTEKKIHLETFESANCGFEADWSFFLTKTLLNIPLKNVTMTVHDSVQRGELMLTPYGIEGSLVYSLGRAIRKAIKTEGSCTVFLDLMPDWSAEKIIDRLGNGPAKESLASYLRKKLQLNRIHLALLNENTRAEERKNPTFLAERIKNLPLTVFRSRPLVEAISSAGGVKFSNLDENLMIKNHPNWFCAGEMLDWEAPTGGFLLQGCFSTAYHAAQGVESCL